MNFILRLRHIFVGPARFFTGLPGLALPGKGASRTASDVRENSHGSTIRAAHGRGQTGRRRVLAALPALARVFVWAAISYLAPGMAANAQEVMEWTIETTITDQRSSTGADGQPDIRLAERKFFGTASYDPRSGVMTLVFEQAGLPIGEPERLNCAGPQEAKWETIEAIDIDGNVISSFEVPTAYSVECGNARIVERIDRDGIPRFFIVHSTRNVTVEPDRIQVTLTGKDAFIKNIGNSIVFLETTFSLARDIADPNRFAGTFYREERRWNSPDPGMPGRRLIESSYSGQTVWTRRLRPEIHDVFVLEDQRARNELDQPYYPYPFGDDPGARSAGKTTRTVFVVGKNLPRRFRDVDVLGSMDPRVQLRLDAIAGEASNVGPVLSLFDQGWKTYGKRSGKPPDGLEAVILEARLKDGVLPGPKGFVLNGARATWTLDFGDAEGQIVFLRETRAAEQAEGGRPENEQTTVAYIHDEIRVRLELANSYPVERFEIELGPEDILQIDLKREDLGPATLARPRLILQRSQDNPRLYLSETVFVVEREDSGQDRPEGPSGTILRVNTPSRVLARLSDTRFRLRPGYATLQVETSPDEIGGSFLAALRRGARCANLPVETDWDRMTTRKVADISNVILTEFGTRSIPVSLGDHAAMLLLRDEFLRRMKDTRRQYRIIAGDDRLLLGLLRGINLLTVDLDRNVLYRMPVPDPETEGGTIEFGYFVSDVFGPALRLNDEAKLRALVRPARTAIAGLLDAIDRSLAMATEVGDCDIEKLLELTGTGFAAVIRGLEPKLMRSRYNRARSRMEIEPDIIGRSAVRNLSVLAEAVRAQQAYSDTDTQFALAIGAAALGGGASLLLGEGILATASAFAIDLAAGTVSSAMTWNDYVRSNRELRFALGAAAVLGTDRLDTAELNAIDWYDVALSTYLEAMGVAAGVAADAISAIKAVRGAEAAEMVARGERIAKSLASGSKSSLSAAEAADFGAFLSNAKNKALTNGTEALSEMERRALARAQETVQRDSPAEMMLAEVRARPAETDPGDFGRRADASGDFGSAGPGTAGSPFDDGFIPETGIGLDDLDSATAPTVILDPANAPTVRLGPDGTPTMRLGPDRAGAALDPANAPTVILDPANAPTVRLGPDGTPTMRQPRPGTPGLDDTLRADTPTLRGTPEELAEIVRKNEPAVPPAARAAGTPGPRPAAVAPGNAEPAERLGFLAGDGRLVELSLGEKLGEGGYNEVFALAGRDDAVVRLSLKPAGGPDLDGIGRRLLEPLAGGQAPIDILRRIEDIPGVPGGFIESLPSPDSQYAGRTLEIVERAPEGAAKAQIARQGGMTAGQAAAFDEAMRHLNRNGLVWLDNHPGNYSFRPLGGDRWQVVVIDPGGIVPAVPSDIGDAAATAAFVQRALDAPPDDLKAAFDIGNMKYRWKAKREVLQEEILPGRVDLEALGLPDASQMPFVATGSEPFAELSRLRALDDAAAAQARAELRARGGLIREVNPKTGAPLDAPPEQ